VESRALARAFDRLDAGSKALLHVSLHHRVPDERLVHVLRTTPAHIAERRDAALRHLAADLDLDGEDPAGAARRALEALPAEQWAALAGGGLAAPAAAAPPPREEPHSRTARALLRDPSLSSAPEAAGAPPPRPSPPPQRRGREPLSPRLIAGGAVLIALVAGVVGLVIALSSGGGDNTTQPRTRAAPASVRLTPAAGASRGAAATAQLTPTNGRALLQLTARGLPASRDTYELWLFNSVADAIPVAQIPESGGSVRAVLPARYRAYRYLDISREPPDDNPNHSGLSILRVPVADLG
jgi:Anti-sigma-K factor rskA